MARSLLRSNKE